MKSKNESGITLVALTILVIMLMVLTTITTYTGVDSIRESHFTKFQTKLKIMQANVNDLYDKYKNDGTVEVNGETYTGEEIANIGEDIPDAKKSAIFNSGASGITDPSGYKYYDKLTLKGLGIEGLDDEDEYYVNIEKRSVVSSSGIDHDGKTYFTLDQTPNPLYNVEYNNTK